VEPKAFAAFQGMPALRVLHLDSADIGDESIDILAGMPGLQSVNLYHTLVTEAGAKRLREARPKCKVIWDRDSARPNRRKT
jgi:hypothetical protein